jgi:hypothetical protein
MRETKSTIPGLHNKEVPMSIQEVRRYQTSDGKVFDAKAEAENHQQGLAVQQKLEAWYPDEVAKSTRGTVSKFLAVYHADIKKLLNEV